MNRGDDEAGSARHLYYGAFHGVLSTQSLEHPGYPFGSVVPFVPDRDGLPLLLLSHLSQHTRNIDADPHCGLTIVEAGEGDVQQRGRLSGVGDVLPADTPADAERYFAYFPQARPYYEQLGFRFYRFRPLRFHWNGGFATARWFSAGRIARVNPLPAEDQARVIEHMNRDHADALAGYLPGNIGHAADTAVVLLGIDAEGIDLRVDDRLIRVALPVSVSDAASAREALVRMARDG